MKIQLISYTENPEELIEKVARVTHDTKTNPDTRSKFIENLLKLGHFSPFEHATVTFLIEDISRVTTHQIVRHRIGVSICQESQRYVKYHDAGFIIPEQIKGTELEEEYRNILNGCTMFYDKAIKASILPEDARYILPSCVTSKMIITFNYRSLMHFFDLRLDKGAQGEIRELANEMLKLTYPIAPSILKQYIH